MEETEFPKPGFYYHYKHDPLGEFNNYAYEVVGVGHHTEISNNEDSLFVVYRPVYESAFVYQNGKMFDVRPLQMFMEDIEKDGKVTKRFTPIIDSEIIKKLKIKKQEMYE